MIIRNEKKCHSQSSSSKNLDIPCNQTAVLAVQTPQQSQQPPQREWQPLIRLSIPGRLQSWNVVMNMHHFARTKLKKAIADAFLSVLSASETDCSTKTICAKSSTSTYYDTLRSYLATKQEGAALRRANAKLKKVKPSTLKSKFLPSKSKKAVDMLPGM